jgi:hypothetical protein
VRDRCPGDFAALLVPPLNAMAGSAHRTAERLESGGHTSGVVLGGHLRPAELLRTR